MKRLEAKGKGILLLHDIQARTVAALPKILHELKARGYRIVHVVPATPDLPKTPTDPQQWQLHPASENVAISHWPKIPNFVFSQRGDALPRPSMSHGFGMALDGKPMSLPEPFDVARKAASARGAFRCRSKAPWPRPWPLSLASNAVAPARAGAEHFRDQGKPARDGAIAASVLSSCRANRSDGAPNADRYQRPLCDPGQAPSRSGPETRCVKNCAGPAPPEMQQVPVRAPGRHLVQVKKRNV